MASYIEQPNRFNTVQSMVPPTGGNGGCSGCGSKSNGFSLQSRPTHMNSSVQSWYDLPIQEPVDPRILIANASLGGVQGEFVRSDNFIGASVWLVSPFNLTGDVTCASLHTDDQLAVAEAAQWNFSHKGNNLAATNPLPLRNKLFLRGGMQFVMSFDINLGVASYPDLQLSFLDNAATSGDFMGGSAGTIPAILFDGSLTGAVTLTVTLKMTGSYRMVISARDTIPNSSMFDMDWIAVR